MSRLLLQAAMPFAVLPPAPQLPFSDESILGFGLRDYQFDMLSDAADLMLRGYRRILLRAPTGAGKTVMATAMLGSAGGQSQFIVHRKELIKQTSETFTRSGLDHGFIAKGWELDFEAEIILAGVQTLVRRLHLTLPPQLLVIDECHHATSDSWARVLSHYPDAWIIGLTATPERLDGRGLNEQFDAMVLGPSEAELIERGFLSPFEFYAPDMPDMAGVATTGGDFQRNAVAAIVDKPKLIGNVVEHYLTLCPGEQGIVFAASRDHSRHLAEEFTRNGISAMHVDGSMTDKERTYFDNAFRAGDIRIGLNCELFGEGYDVPNISYVGDVAPTRSRIKARQRWGRPLRIQKGKSRAIICDHAGNAVRLNDFPDLDYEWSLEGRAKKPRSSGPDDAISIRQCMTCFRVSPSLTRICPGCGTEFPIQVRTLTQEAGKLTKLEKEELQRANTARRKAEDKACSTYAEFKSLAEARGYPDPHRWATTRMKMKRGNWRF